MFIFQQCEVTNIKSMFLLKIVLKNWKKGFIHKIYFKVRSSNLRIYFGKNFIYMQYVYVIRSIFLSSLNFLKLLRYLKENVLDYSKISV